VHLFSPNGRYDVNYLRNYAVLNVRDVLGRIEGAGQVQVFGAGDYSMRCGSIPDKVAARAASPRRTLRLRSREQNANVAAGVIARRRRCRRRLLPDTGACRGWRLTSEQEFGDIVVQRRRPTVP